LTGPTLAEAFDPRDNVLTAMRLALAGAVATVHALAVGFGHQPWLGSSTVGDLAVDGFFVLSGFLVTASLLKRATLTRYAWHRVLRIMPGFWVCLLVIAVVVAPVIAVMQGRSALSVWTAEEDSAVDFLVQNSALLMNQFGIAGLPEDVPTPGVLNGALWTLFYEAICYIAIAVLGVIGILRRPVLVGGIVLVLWVVTAVQVVTPVLEQERLLRFLLLFMLGALALLQSHRVPMRWWLAVGSLGLVALGLVLLPDYRALAAPAFTYLMLYLMVRVPPPSRLVSDYSYGLYVYHWPVQQVLLVAGLTALGEPAFVVITVGVALAVAAVSWRVIERPALSLKDAVWVDRIPALRVALERPPAGTPTGQEPHKAR
jgi:peptidoglycan/LPS O-acetylase OafA/YrhL